MSYIWKVVIMSICAYFIGNITFARIIAKKRGDDITTHGSGNPGTTNMMRTHGAKRGFLTFGLDFLKGFIVALTAYLVCGGWNEGWQSFLFGGFNGNWQSNLALYIVGACAVMGHIYPVIFKFKGGKGVATGAGVVAVANPIVLVLLVALYWVILYFVKVAGSIMSLGASIIFTIIETTMLCIYGYYYSLIPLYIILILVIWAHRANIKRIWARKEGKMDLKAAFEKDKEEKLKREQEKLNK